MKQLRYIIEAVSGTAGERENKLYDWRINVLRGEAIISSAIVRSEHNPLVTRYHLSVRHYKNTTIIFKEFESDKGEILAYGNSKKDISEMEKIILNAPHKDIALWKVDEEGNYIKNRIY